MIYVDDANLAACGNAGIVYNGTTTLTASKIIAGTSMTMSGTAAVTGNTTLGTLDVTGDTSLSTLNVTGDATLGGLNVQGDITFDSLTVTGDVIAGGFESLDDIEVVGDANIGGHLDIGGTTTHEGAIGFGGDIMFNPAHGAYVIPLTGMFSFLKTDATANIDASLAYGQNGQLKIVILGEDGGSDVVITPYNFGNGTTLTLDTAKQYAVFIFVTDGWWALSHNGTIA